MLHRMPIGLDDVSELIKTRRTSLLIDPVKDVPLALVTRLCELALWAPNHKRTWPSRFTAFTGDGRSRLGEAFADDLADSQDADAPRIAKTRTKYLRAPVVVLVGSAAHPNPKVQRENEYTVAAGVQNLLLGATAAGLASFWSSPPLDLAKRVSELANFEPATRLLAVVYLGWPSAEVGTPERPSVQIHVVQ
jgi:nitroreductase